MNFLHPKAYPSYFQFCQNLFWKGHFGGWGRLREDRLETFRRIVESHVKMRLKKDYLKDELPMKNPDETVVLELPREKMEAYRKIVSEGYETISEFLTVRSEFEAAFGKPVIGKDKAEQEFARGVAERLGLERILKMDAVTSPAFYVLNRLRTFLAAEAAGPKLAYVRELAAKRMAEGKNLIVLTSYLETVNLIQKELEGVAETLRITGSVSGRKRTEVVSDFQSRRGVVLVATTMSVGVGVTLTNSDALVFFDEVFDDKFMLQASDRIYRIGQKDTVTVSTLTYR